MKTFASALAALFLSSAALAQQAQGATPPPPAAWYWTWPMAAGDCSFSFWWIFPLLMFVMMVACAVMIVPAIRSGAGPMHCGCMRANDRKPGAAADAGIQASKPE